MSRSRLTSGCIAVLSLSLTACSAGEPVQKAPVRVAVLQVAAVDRRENVVLTGDIQARKVTDQSFRLSGKLIKRYVDVGDRVRANQVLARLDPRDQQTDLASADAEVAVRESRLQLAQQNYRRQQLLLPKGYTNLSEYQQARSSLESAKGDLASWKAQRANARDEVGYTELLAAADGVITARHGEEGQVMQAATPVFSLAHDGEREAVFSAYESLLGTERTGDPVLVRVLGQADIVLPGKIREITPIVSSTSGTLRVRVELPNASPAPALGTVVSVQVQNPSQRAFALPWSALTRSHGKPAVWLVNAEARVRLVSVQVLNYEPEQVVISTGLSDGDLVVARGLQFLYPDQKIEVAERTSASAAQALAASEPAL